MDAIIVKNLKKKFTVRERKPGIVGSVANLFTSKKKEISAVSDVNFTIGQGELVGYLGPNGAGKSTTIKMLTGILRPDSGEISINGVNPVKNRKQLTRQIGVVFGQKTQLWWDLPVAESFDLLRVIYKIPRDRYQKQLDTFFELLNLKDFWRQPTRQLSLGQRMRSDLAASLLHQPPVLFLDEPTIGLDILTRDAIRSFIKYLNETLKTTIILTTHDMQDIEFLANRLILLDQGQIHYDGQLDSFVEKYSNDKLVSIHLEKESPAELLESTRFEVASRLSDRNFEVKMKANESVAALIEAISATGARIREINVRKPELSDTLKVIYRGKRNLEL